VELRVGAKKTLSAFRSVDGSPNIFLADKGDLRCTAIKLNNNQVALFSPVQGLGHDAIESLAPLGRVTFLLAPNYYHNKGLAEYGAAFPNACLCAPEAAQPRLKKLTGLSFQGLDGLCGVLPDHMSIIQPDAGEQSTTVRDLKSMLGPYPSDHMICWPVSARIGNVKNNDPSLIEPVAAT
jgi:hypothetical protein